MLFLKHVLRCQISLHYIKVVMRSELLLNCKNGIIAVLFNSNQYYKPAYNHLSICQTLKYVYTLK